MSTSVPRIVVGTSSIGSVLWSREDVSAFRYLDGVLDAGCTTFDLAASYQLGGTERLFGAWMASRRNRERVFVITKGGHPVPILAPHRLTARAITDDLHASLARLRTDHVDLYLLHKDDATARLEPVVEALVRFHREGKILAWGVSNFTHERVREIDALGRAADLPIAASSPHFSLFPWVREPYAASVSIAGPRNRDARAFYEKSRIPVFAWSPLGAGFAADRKSRAYDSAENRARLRRASAIADAHGASASQIALAYVLSQPFVTRAVVASHTVERMRENILAAAIVLTEEETRWLDGEAISSTAASV